MGPEQASEPRTAAQGSEMLANYKKALEAVISRLPVKNGVVDIDAIWIEMSIPYDLLRKLLQRNDLELPENVERINMKSRVRKGAQSSGSKRRRKR